MKILYGEPTMNQDDLNLVRSIIYNNTITTMQTILEYCETFELKSQCLPENEEAFTKVMEADENDDLDAELGAAMDALWKDPGVQATWDRRCDYQIVESLKYYFKNIMRISEPGYMNKDEYTKEEQLQYQQDALLARVRTSGIVTEAYNIDGKMFEMYDVGGQRNERRKWIHCFDHVTAVIFVTAISEYDQVMPQRECLVRASHPGREGSRALGGDGCARHDDRALYRDTPRASCLASEQASARGDRRGTSLVE